MIAEDLARERYGETHGAGREREPAFGIINWAHLLEDFLDQLGVSFEDFRDEFMGSWIFGYAQALRSVGVRPVLFYVSARTRDVERFTHAPTGAELRILPAPAVYRWARRRVLNPYAETVEQAVGHVARAARPVFGALKAAMPYLSTPLIRLAQEARRENCRALLCQEYENPRFDCCVLLGRILRLPVYATFQGGDRPQGRAERALRPLSLRASAGLIVPTTSEMERVQARYGVAASKIFRIFNPIDCEAWRPLDRRRARAELGIADNAKLAVWHGRVLLKRKGLDVLVDAWQRLCAKTGDPDLRLLLIGTGEDAEDFSRLLASKRPPGITWRNEFTHDRAALRTCLSAANVFVLPSRHEGFPVAPLEAMGCGLPIVAAAANGMPDILEAGERSGGMTVPREDPAALAAALEALLFDPAYAEKLGRRARARVSEQFSHEAVGRQLRGLLPGAAEI